MSFTWMDDTVFAVELASNVRVVRLAHTHSLYNTGIEKDYLAEPQVGIYQDFPRLLFTSNWGRFGTDAVDTYMIELPKNWMEHLPKETNR